MFANSGQLCPANPFHPMYRRYSERLSEQLLIFSRSGSCDPVDCSMPGFPVLHHLLEPAHPHPTISSSASSSSSCSQSFLASGSFPMSQLFTSDGQSFGASASTSVLPMIFKADFLLDGLVLSPCSPRDSQESSPTPQFKTINSSESSSTPQFKTINSLVLNLLYGPTLTSIHASEHTGLFIFVLCSLYFTDTQSVMTQPRCSSVHWSSSAWTGRFWSRYAVWGGFQTPPTL